MSWKKGQSGNPNGRPRCGDSLAEQIRAAGTPERRKGLLDRMWEIACAPHPDTHARIKAADWIARHGWPEEARGQTTVTTDGQVTTVTHVYITAPSDQEDAPTPLPAHGPRR